MQTEPEHFFARPLGWWTTLVALCLMLLMPLLFADVPPVLDYPNHLARLFVLSRAANDPVLGAFWQPHWALIPDLATDLVIPKLMNVMPALAAGKIMLALAVLAPVLGAVAYSRAAFGKRLYWPMMTGFMAYNVLFVMGFMNCLISIGGALAAAALWLRLRERPAIVRASAGAICATALFLAHLMGLAFYGLLVGAAEANKLEISGGWQRFGRSAWRSTALLGVTFAIPVILWIHVQRHTLTTIPPHWTFSTKIFYLAFPFMGYQVLPGALIAVIFLANAMSWFMRREGGIGPGIAIAIASLFALWLGLPYNTASGLFIDGRVAFMLLLVLAAGIRPPQLPTSSWRYAALGALGVALLVQITLIAATWRDHEVPVAELRSSISAIPPGSKVLTISAPPDTSKAYWRDPPSGIITSSHIATYAHLPALLAIEQRAFWPLLFADPSQHPVIVQPPYAAIAGEGDPPELEALIVEHQVNSIYPAPYLENWQDKFDFVLLINAGAVDDVEHFLPDKLQLLNRSRFAALFRVRKLAASATQ
jgi:hypothetical protein